MINPIYGVNCLKLGFQRYKRYCKLPIEINVSRSSVSFYISKNNNNEKLTNTRISNHHTKLQRYTDNGREPWLFDNISIEFITPNSDEDKKVVRGRVYQNRLGTIQPFDVTIYQYNSDLIEPSDIVVIFKSIIVFLNGNGYIDPFKDTFKKAKVIPRHSNIKPYNRRTSNIQTESLVNNQRLSIQKLNEVTSYCLQGLIPENNNNIKSKNTMKQKIRLTEGDLHRIVRKCMNEAMNEGELWNNVKDVARGATYGASHGFNKVADDNNNVHTLANGLSYACDAFGKIMKALSKQDIEEAEYLCKQAYTECKRDLNSTWGRGTASTSDYGAQHRI